MTLNPELRVEMSKKFDSMGFSGRGNSTGLFLLVYTHAQIYAEKYLFYFTEVSPWEETENLEKIKLSKLKIHFKWRKSFGRENRKFTNFSPIHLVMHKKLLYY